MTIEVVLLDGLNCPMIRCDVCEKTINKQSDGVYCWDLSKNEEGKGIVPYFAHHNTSDVGNRCHDALEAGFAKYTLGWGHVSELFRMLQANVPTIK